jgi:hypothetical protein
MSAPCCDTEWLREAGVMAHEDDCPIFGVAAGRSLDDEPCQAEAVGFCGCERCKAKASGS